MSIPPTARSSSASWSPGASRSRSSIPPDTRFAKEFRRLAVQAAQQRLGFWAATPPADGAMPYGLTTGAARVRKGPGTGFAVNANLTKDTPLTVYGRTPAGDWLQVRTPTRAGGWIAASLVRLNVPISQVPVPANIPAAAAPVVPAAPKAPRLAPSMCRLLRQPATATRRIRTCASLRRRPISTAGRFRTSDFG